MPAAQVAGSCHAMPLLSWALLLFLLCVVVAVLVVRSCAAAARPLARSARTPVMLPLLRMTSCCGDKAGG